MNSSVSRGLARRKERALYAGQTGHELRGGEVGGCPELLVPNRDGGQTRLASCARLGPRVNLPTPDRRRVDLCTPARLPFCGRLLVSKTTAADRDRSGFNILASSSIPYYMTIAFHVWRS